MQGQGAFWFDLTDLQLPRSCKEHDRAVGGGGRAVADTAGLDGRGGGGGRQECGKGEGRSGGAGGVGRVSRAWVEMAGQDWGRAEARGWAEARRGREPGRDLFLFVGGGKRYLYVGSAILMRCASRLSSEDFNSPAHP